MQLIENNPYRILGVLSNSPQKEIVANLSKIKAFSKAKKAISFDYDFSGILSAVVRDENTAANAYSTITLPKDKLAAGFFWFMKITNIDEIALNNLRSGETDKAIEILRKKPTVSACINLAVLNLIKGQYNTALYYYVYLLNDADKRTELLSIIVDNPELLSEDEVVQVFSDKLLSSFLQVNWLESLNQKQVYLGDQYFDIKDFFLNSNVYEYLSGKSCSSAIKLLEEKLEASRTVNKQDAKANLKAAEELVELCKNTLRSIRTSLGKENNKYIKLCDAVSIQILDSCTQYYIHDKDNKYRSKEILKYLRFAMRTAEGKIAKDRCKKNFDLIKAECDEIVPEEILGDISYIHRQIEEYKKFYAISGSNYVGNLNGTLFNCYQKLETVKNKVGSENKHYITESSNVVNFGIESIINEVNIKLSQYRNKTNESARIELRDALKWGKPIFEMLKSFSKDVNCSQRYDSSLAEFLSCYSQYYFEGQPSQPKAKPVAESSVIINETAPSSIKAGETFRFEITINKSNAEILNRPQFSGVEVIAGPNTGHQTNVGKENSTIIRYSLLGISAGTYNLPAINIKVGTSIHRSKPVRIVVMPNLNSSHSFCGQTNTGSTYSKPKGKSGSASQNKKTDYSWVWLIACVIVIGAICISQCNDNNSSNTSGTVHSTQSTTSSTTSNTTNSLHPNSSYYSTPKTEPQKERVNEPEYTEVQFSTGDRPYQSFYGRGRYDSETENSLQIKNGSSSDAVVFLESLSGQKVRHVYVRKGDNYRMTQIPGGKYIIKTYQGNSWNPNKNNGSDAPLGGFVKNVYMSKSEANDPFDYPYPSSGSYIDYEVTFKVTNGNMRTESINSSEMF